MLLVAAVGLGHDAGQASASEDQQPVRCVGGRGSLEVFSLGAGKLEELACVALFDSI